VREKPKSSVTCAAHEIEVFNYENMKENAVESANVSTRILLLDESCDLHRLLDLKDYSKYEAVLPFLDCPETKQWITRSIGKMCYSLGDILKNADFSRRI
jgi:hypothetical protein